MVNRDLIQELRRRKPGRKLLSKQAVYQGVARVKRARQHALSLEEASWVYAANQGIDVSKYLDENQREKLRALLSHQSIETIPAPPHPSRVGSVSRRRSAARPIIFDGSKVDVLHPVVKRAAGALFKNRHYSEAVEKAFRSVNRYVRRKTKRTHDGGAGMMHDVFTVERVNKLGCHLRLNRGRTQSEKDEQEGFRLIFAGAQQGIRNPFAHDDARINDPWVAFEYLCFASLLARKVDSANLV